MKYYRDDRFIGMDEGGTFLGYHLDDVAAMRAELELLLAGRRRHYPDRVRKGDMLAADADYRLAIGAEIRADLDLFFGPGAAVLVDPQFPWEAKVAELERELGNRERYWPERVGKGDMLADEAAARTLALRRVHALYWHHMLGFVAPEEQPARANAIRAHIALVDSQDRQKQEELEL